MTLRNTHAAIDQLRDMVNAGRSSTSYQLDFGEGDEGVDLEAVRDYLSGAITRTVLVESSTDSMTVMDTAGRCLLRAYNARSFTGLQDATTSLELAVSDFIRDHGEAAARAALDEVLVEFPKEYDLERFTMIARLHDLAVAFVQSSQG